MSNLKILLIASLFILVLAGAAAAEEAVPEQSVPDTPWSGIWQTNLFTMKLSQNGDAVSGTYTTLNPNVSVTGSLNGTVSEEGTVLSGSWLDLGVFHFTMSDDHSSFSGTGGYVEEPDTYFGDNTDNWTGTWNSVEYSVVFVQDGDTVTGSIIYTGPESGETAALMGTLSEDGKELSGSFTESGRFTYNLGEGGTFFNGTSTFGSDTTVRPFDFWNGTRIQ